jgi:protein-disulfide isomerase
MSEQQLAPAVTEVDHVLGPADARVTLIEYGDFECPYCGAAYPVLKRVKQRLGDRLRFVFRHFPLADLHLHAEHAAEAAESVSSAVGPEAFWKMHDLLFEHQRRLDDRMLVRYAEQAGADPAVVAVDLAEGRYRELVRQSFRSGARSGVNGTPTLFIDGIRYDGPRDEESLVATLERVAAQGENVRRARPAINV